MQMDISICKIVDSLYKFHRFYMDFLCKDLCKYHFLLYILLCKYMFLCFSALKTCSSSLHHICILYRYRICLHILLCKYKLLCNPKRHISNLDHNRTLYSNRFYLQNLLCKYMFS
ncbi:hypothetical protein X975_14562, partial [Stegodyphus mimosarum]